MEDLAHPLVEGEAFAAIDLERTQQLGDAVADRFGKRLLRGGELAPPSAPSSPSPPPFTPNTLCQQLFLFSGLASRKRSSSKTRST